MLPVTLGVGTPVVAVPNGAVPPHFGVRIDASQVPQLRLASKDLEQSLTQLEKDHGVKPDTPMAIIVRFLRGSQPNTVKALITMPVEGVPANVNYNPGYNSSRMESATKPLEWPLNKPLDGFLNGIVKLVKANYDPGSPKMLEHFSAAMTDPTYWALLGTKLKLESNSDKAPEALLTQLLQQEQANIKKQLGHQPPMRDVQDALRQRYTLDALLQETKALAKTAQQRQQLENLLKT